MFKPFTLNWIELNWIELNWIELNWIDYGDSWLISKSLISSHLSCLISSLISLGLLILWYLILDPWSLILDPWSLISWCFDPWLLDSLTPWLLDSLISDLWSLILDSFLPFFRLLDLWSLMLDLWSLISDPWCLLLDPSFLPSFL